jgi:amino acid adenylation domain-containing protein
MVADDHQRVDHLPVLSGAERHRILVEWNPTEAHYPGDRCIHELFEEQVEKNFDAVALSYEGRQLTYGELNAQANQLSHYLREIGVRPDDRVAVCVERGFKTIVGLLAVLKAGGAYVPLDPTYPIERLNYMLTDSAPVALLTERIARETLRDLPLKLSVLDLSSPTPPWSDHPVTNPRSSQAGLTSNHLAYVVYTSGSTGKPKGVMISTGALAQHICACRAYYRITAADKILQSASISFDVSIEQTFCALASGATLVIRDPRVSEYLDVTVAGFTPSYFQAILETNSLRLPGLRLLLLGGEPLSTALLSRWKKDCLTLHAYGPTETTITATHYDLHPDGVRSLGTRDYVPIGRPLATKRIYILDEQGQPVPIGVKGELHIGGAGVARGYLNQAELTAEKFIRDPFSPESGARMYKTGDLARWLPDGNIEFLGRNDFQVKVRGFRIEPGEIEGKLMEHPWVGEAAVVAREDASGDKRLVAYYVGRETPNNATGIVDAAAKLREFLSGQLPDYMVPAAYVRLESLPLTPNGKLDRRALPAPDALAYALSEYEPPQGEVETALAGIWSEVLKLERVGRHDNFFELGGHSLVAVRMISRVRQLLGVEVTLSALFAQPVLVDFAGKAAEAPSTRLPAIGRAEDNNRRALSFAQQRLWFLAQMGEGISTAYHIPAGLRLSGALDQEALRRALDRMVTRHEALRTSFPVIDGTAVQRIAPEEGSHFYLREHDLSGHADSTIELERLAREEAATPFNLEKGPLIRGRLILEGEQEHVLLVTMHHIVSDGWSMGVWMRELSALYEAYRCGKADPLPPLEIQYADYAAWQRHWVSGDVLRQQAEYWKTTLAGAPALLELPTDYRRPAEQDYAGAYIAYGLDAELTQSLKALSHRHGVTLFMTLLSSWAVLLARLSSQEEVVIGTPTANRGRREIEGLIGFFVNTLALRIDVSGSPTVGEFLARVKAQALAAQQHQDIPFEQVVEVVRPARSLGHSPLFQVMLAWQNATDEKLELSGLTLTPLAAAPRTRATYDLSLSLMEVGERIEGGVEYATALFGRATVDRYLGHWRTLLEAMVADDRQTVDLLAVLTAEERRQVLFEWNDTGAEYPEDRCIHELFEEQVEKRTDGVAVVAGDRHLSYGELNAQANRLAHYLRELGVQPDDRVAVCLERGLEMVVALMAVLKSGGAYVPLDPEYPAERLAFMLADSAPKAVLTGGRLKEVLNHLPISSSLPVLEVDVDARELPWATQPANNIGPSEVGLTSSHLAYIIFTSGSTGTPKGVMVEHRSVCNQITMVQECYQLRPRDRYLQFASINFDVSVEEIFGALLSGAGLVLRSDAWLADTSDFWRLCERNAITCLSLPTQFWRLLAKDQTAEIPACIRLVSIGGEAIDQGALEAWFDARGHRPRLFTGYGPTEATVTTTIRELEPGAQNCCCIGRPVSNLRVYILDHRSEPVPIGVKGELHIGGAGVARGYLNQAELTAEKFIRDPFSPESGARMYKTGDLARWLPDGNIEFLGRNDFQVKVRGFRIEPGEIEGKLMEHPWVGEAAVVAREDASGDKRLVAYYVGRETPNNATGIVDAAAKLREFLSGQLPDYMVPAAYVRLESLPLTPNGKLDRRALPAPDALAYALSEYEPPQGEVETALAGIWSEVLKLERVGRHDNFFELGGHSLVAVRMISRVRQLLGVEVTLSALFARPVLTSFARGISEAIPAVLPAIRPVKGKERLALSFAQQGLWFLAQLDQKQSQAYHVPFGLRLNGVLDEKALVKTLDRLVARHEILRTTFIAINGEPQQRIMPGEESHFSLVKHDLRGQPKAETELERLALEEASAPFDLERGPLIRGRLIRTAEQEHTLLITIHHIVCDGWSIGVLLRELGALYDAYRQGKADPLPPLPVQYADYAAWQRRYLAAEAVEEHANYWKAALAGAPPLLELPTDRPRPMQQDFAGAAVECSLDEELTKALKALSQRHGTTLFMTLLAGWAVLLARLSGQPEVVIGTPSANRSRHEIEELIGFFLNTLALRVDVSASPTVSELLQRVKAVTLDAQQHQDIPFEQVVQIIRPERSLAYNPLFQVMFVWQNTPEGDFQLDDLKVAPFRGVPHATASFDLSLALGEVGERIEGGMEYATALFDRSTVEVYLSRWQTLLRGMVADDQQRVEHLPLLSNAERNQLNLRIANITGRAALGR